jgi:alkylation response protein AidB-like acyl-CoA dehydrogenase
VLPAGLLDEVIAAGLLGLYTASPVQACALDALVARRSGSLAVALGVSYLGLVPIYAAAEPALEREVDERVRDGQRAALLLSELEHGSDLLRITTRASRAGDGYVLDGTKDLINGGSQHDILVTLARAPAPGPRGDLGLYVAFRDATIATVHRWHTLPVAAADIASVRLDGTVVPAHRRLGRDGDGFDLVQRTLAISRAGVAAFAAGACSGARDLAEAYAARRTLHGAPLAASGAIRDHLEWMRALDRIAAATALHAACAVNAYGEGASAITAIAKIACCDLAEEVVAHGRHILGARALVLEAPYARFVRDVLVYGTFDGTRHVVLEQLSWRLAQAAANPDAGELAVYAAPPCPLREVARRRGPVRLVDMVARARAVESTALASLGGALVDLVRHARRDGTWDRDQPLRFEAATLYAHLGALVALAELFAADDAIGRYGARVAARLRSLALRARIAIDVEDAERAFL